MDVCINVYSLTVFYKKYKAAYRCLSKIMECKSCRYFFSIISGPKTLFSCSLNLSHSLFCFP